MEFEDSRFALFPEPNAYIQKFDNVDKDKEIKKVVFQEPYETLPNHYINNNFAKHNCNCGCNENNHNDNSHKDALKHNNGFDIKNFLPLLGMFNKGGGQDLSWLVRMLNNGVYKQGNNSSNLINMISSLLSNQDTMSGILNLFKGGGLNLFNKNKTIDHKLKTTDYEIKNYTRVE